MPALKYGILTVLVLIALGSSAALAQCGPGCPACSGGVTDSILDPNTIRGSVMYIPDGEEETVILNFSGTVTQWLELGLGYSVDKEKVIWNAKAQLVKEQAGAWRPSLVLGTGSVEIGGSDQSGYLQLFKNIDTGPDIVWGLSGGFATDLPDLTEGFWLTTASLTYRETLTPFYSYDGSASHIGLTWYAKDWLQVSGTYLEMEDPAITVGITRALGGK